MATYNHTHSLPSRPALSHPISIVDVFFPGLTSISTILHQIQTGNPNSFAGMLCVCGMVVFLGRYAYNYLGIWVATHFTSTIYVSNSNEAYDMIVSWVSSQSFTHQARSSLVSVGARRTYTATHFNGPQKKPLQYSPWNGSFFFWYENHLLTFRCVQKEGRIIPEEEISISCMGRSPAVLKQFFSDCRAEYLKLVKNKTSVFEHRAGDWKRTRTMDIRPLDTVILNQENKTALLKDIKAFLDPRARAWYSRRGIPYRRGYLLYGPPGTGKSSLSLSIAGGSDLDIYILNLSSVDDSSLGALFAELPTRCVILLEDIDAVDTTHSRQREMVNTSQDETDSFMTRRPRGRVSLSVLLNVVDGVGSQEGRVLIMTTNHVERLDAALIRPGRVDMKLELGLTTHDINAQLFSTIFLRDDASNQGWQVEDKVVLEKLATDFATKVPEHEFSPAEIQSFLLECRQSPRMAVEKAQEWVVRAQLEKRQITRADSWVRPEGFCGDIPVCLSD